MQRGDDIMDSLSQSVDETKNERMFGGAKMSDNTGDDSIFNVGNVS